MRCPHGRVNNVTRDPSNLLPRCGVMTYVLVVGGMVILNTAGERRRGHVHQGGGGKEGGTAIQRSEGEE